MPGTSIVKAHVDLSPSSAHRWMPCPGSVELSRTVEKPAESEFAREGTIAHALAELALKNGADPEKWVGLKIDGWEITEDMADHVRVYVDYCNTLRAPARDGIYWIERKFDLKALTPPEPMRGTSDFVSYYGRFLGTGFDAEGVLEVVDLKYGQGVPVEVEWNPQELYYAVGALIAVQEERQLPIDKIKITIVQPRLLHKDGPVRSWEIDIEDLLAWTDTLLKAARQTREPNAPLVPGEHCRFCPAAAICPALERHALSAAQMDFEVLDGPTPPAQLSTRRLGEVAKLFPMMEAWMNAVRAEMLARAEQGDVADGFKIVEKKANRRWQEEQWATEERLAALGFTQFEMFEVVLRSVAQLEKKVGKKRFKELTEGADNLITKQSSGYTLAPADDVRPALALGAQTDFEVVTEADTLL